MGDARAEEGGPLARFLPLFRPAILAEGARIVARNLRGANRRRHAGNARRICLAVVEERWNGRYYSAGPGYLDQLWTRDLGWCAPSLCRIGRAERVRATLAVALEAFARAGRCTTTVLGGRHPADFFSYGSDTLPFILATAKVSRASDLLARHRALLQAEAARYFQTVYDEGTGLARAARRFSETKDVVDFRATCYTNCMVAWTARLLRETGVAELGPDPVRQAARVVDAFWTGSAFRNDRERPGAPPLVSGDANIWPFLTGVASDDALLRAAVRAVQGEGLDRPFPLKYHAHRHPRRHELLNRIFMPNYQGDAIWAMTGMLFARLCLRADPPAAARYAESYAREVERHGTYVEVFEPDGSAPLRGRFGHEAARGMLWAAMLPPLLDDAGLGVRPNPCLDAPDDDHA